MEWNRVNEWEHKSTKQINIRGKINKPLNVNRSALDVCECEKSIKPLNTLFLVVYWFYRKVKTNISL